MKIVIEVSDEDAKLLLQELQVRKQSPGYYETTNLNGIIQQAWRMGIGYFRRRAWRYRQAA